MTKESLEDSQGNFTIGFLAGRIKNLRILSFSQELLTSSPISLPLIDGTQRDNLAQLLSEMIGDRQEAREWVNFKLSATNWLDTFNRTLLHHAASEND